MREGDLELASVENQIDQRYGKSGFEIGRTDFELSVNKKRRAGQGIPARTATRNKTVGNFGVIGIRV